MQRLARIALSSAAVLGLAAGLLAVGAAAGAPPQSVSEQPAEARLDPITQLQSDLVRVPGNYTAWSQLGFAYLTKARLTADPAVYGQAEGAFKKALELRPADNDVALTGLASLAAARHEFARAVELTDRSLAINDFSPTTYAVRADALTELGRYDEALAAVQRQLDLSPARIDGLARASYQAELRGDVEQATSLFQQGREAALTPGDKAFASYYLGELAWNSGDVDGAAKAYAAGLADDPNFMFLVAGRAKVLAARGDTAAAASEYLRVVERVPLPEFVVAYGELLEATGQKEAAEEQYTVLRTIQRLYAVNGQDVDTELALFEADHGTPAAALASAEKAYAKRPDGVFTQDAYAWALHAAGRDAEALPIAKQAVRLGYRNPSFYYHLGAIALGAGDKALAKTALTKALALNPSFSPLHAPRAMALLADLS